jgi:hypothetical protein
MRAALWTDPIVLSGVLFYRCVEAVEGKRMAFEPTDGQISDFLARKECGASATDEQLITSFNRWQDRVTGLGRRISADGRTVIIEVTPTPAETTAIESARKELTTWLESIFSPGSDERQLHAYLSRLS